MKDDRKADHVHQIPYTATLALFIVTMKALLLNVLMHCTSCTLADIELAGFQKVPLKLESTLADIELAGFQKVPLKLEYLGPRQKVVMSDKGVTICRFGTCYYSSFETLNQRFPGLFPTVEEYEVQTGLPTLLTKTCAYFKAQTDTSLGSTRETECLAKSGDGDDCCQTYKSIVPYTIRSNYRSLHNVEGQQCYTLQLFTVGTCGNNPASNECKNCLQETNLMSLYAYNYVTSHVGFYNFHIQSYCSCKALN